MQPDLNGVMEQLNRMIRVIGHDPALQEWFSRLARLDPVHRRNAILTLCNRMADEDNGATLAPTFQLLADTRIFNATMAALRTD